MDISHSLLPECSLLIKSLGFNGNHYTYWKQKMKDFIKAMDIDMWDIVENGYEIPTILVKGVY